MRSSLVIALTTLVLSLMTTTASWAQFNPVQIVAEDTTCSQPDIFLDGADAPLFAFLCDGNVFFGSLNGTPDPITTDSRNSTSVTLTRSQLQLRVAFAEEAQAGDPSNRNIRLASNSGSGFGFPVNLTLTAADECCPDIASTGLSYATAWHEVGSPDNTIFLNRNFSGGTVPIGSGSNPSLALSPTTEAFLVYERGGDLYLNTETGGVVGTEVPVVQTGTATLVEMDRPGSVVHVLLLDQGDLFYTSNAGGSFATPVLVASGPFDGADIAAHANGGSEDTVGVVYSTAGMVKYTALEGGVFGAPVDVAPGSDPTVDFDSFGFPHVGFADNGQILYANAVPVPTVDFTADTTSGEIIIQTTFTSQVTSVINSYLWDFGDGNTSTEPNPVHLYNTVGSFDVSLTVSGPGGSAQVTKPNFVQTSPPTQIYRIPDINIFPGQQVQLPIAVQHTLPIDGFQFAIAYDSADTAITNFSLLSTATAALNPEFMEFSLNDDGTNEFLLAAVIIDFMQPFDGRQLIPTPNTVLALVEFTVPAATPVGEVYEVNFQNGLGGILNVFSSNGELVIPFLESSTLTVTDPPNAIFNRGDANNDLGIINIADSIFIISYLFLDGPVPVCIDAADVNDDGSVNIADSVYLLNYLFVDGAPSPPYPFPARGTDPTPDNLGDC